jgi:hypothetical protein
MLLFESLRSLLLESRGDSMKVDFALVWGAVPLFLATLVDTALRAGRRGWRDTDLDESATGGKLTRLVAHSQLPNESHLRCSNRCRGILRARRLVILRGIFHEVDH